MQRRIITKTCQYNFDPLKSHFYVVKLGFTRVYIIFFLFLLKSIDCGYSLEPPHRGGSNEYPQSMFFKQNKKNNVYPCKPQLYYIQVGLMGSKLYRRVFVMGNLFSLEKKNKVYI